MGEFYSVETRERRHPAGTSGRDWPVRTGGALGNNFHCTANPFAPEGIPATSESDESEPS